MKKQPENPQKSIKEKIGDPLVKILNGPGRIKLKDLKKRKPKQ